MLSLEYIYYALPYLQPPRMPSSQMTRGPQTLIFPVSPATTVAVLEFEI